MIVNKQSSNGLKKLAKILQNNMKQQKNLELLKVFYVCYIVVNYLQASSIATATATVAPTIGLLPIPIKPIIST